MRDEWTPQRAEEFAAAHGIEMREKQWRAIAASRELIAETGRAPRLDDVSSACGLTVAEIRQLFSGAAEVVLAHLAGAPQLERRKAP